MGIIRRLLQVTLLLFTLVIGVAAGGVIVTQTVWFRDWLRGFIVRQGNQYLNGRLTIGRLGGNIFFGVEVEDVDIAMNGEPVVTIKDARIAYSVLQLLTRNLVITSLKINEPIVHMRREGGTWDLSQLIKKQAQENKNAGPGLPVSVDDIVVTGGSFMFDDRPVGTSGVDVPREVNRLDAHLSFAYSPVHYTVDIANISFRGQAPPFGLNALSGKIAVTGGSLYLDKVAIRTAASDIKIDGTVYNYANTPSLDVRAASDKMDFREIASIIPALGRVQLQPAFQLSAKGPLDNLQLNFSVRSKAGDVTGNGVVDAAAPERRVAATIHVRDFNLAPVLGNPRQKTDVTGVARVDMRMADNAAGINGVRGTYEIKAEKVAGFGYAARDVNARGRIDAGKVALNASARAYGARGTATGTLTVPAGNRAMAFDVAGRLENADLRRLPRSLKVPQVATQLNLDYHVIGAGTSMKGDAVMRPSTLAGARIGNGTRGTFSYGGGQATYSADGTIAGLNLARVGQQFNIAALKGDRFESDVNARFKVSGSGTTPATMRANAAITLANSTLAGTTIPELALNTTIADQRLQATVNGQFQNLNPAQFTGSNAAKGSISGAANLTVGLANFGAPAARSSMLDNLSVDGKLALQPSTVGGLRIDKANFDGRYANRAGHIKQLTVTGPDLQLQARGPLSLGNQGESNLQYELTTPSLASIGKLANVAAEGALTLNGKVTGNASGLRTTGTLKGANFGYGATQALNLTSQYDVTLPNLDSSQARVGATTTATFVTLAGQNINRVTARTTYANNTLDLEGNFEQPKRSLKVAGNVVLHPQHREIHLRSLALHSGGVQWQTAPGTEPAIDYGSDNVTVKDVRLINGNQEITATGNIGPRASNLQARLINFNLANVDALMLTDRQLGGVLNAQATITGPRDAMNVAGQFNVSGGSFRQFRYQSLDGRMDYARNRVTLDVRFTENPQAWVRANGSIPLALFSAKPGPDAAQPVDVTVQSSMLDLGLVQGFTTAIQNAAGTAQLNARVTGTAAAPNMSGGLQVRGGTFKVVPTGVTYSALNADIALQPDRVTVRNLSLVDNHKAQLTMAGDLALHERQLGGVNVTVRSNDFKVIDNELGNLRVNTNVAVAGEVRAPRITGTVGVNTGTINIDKVLEAVSSSPYSTTAEAVPANAGGQPGSQPIGQPVNQPAKNAQVDAQTKTMPGTPAEHGAAAAPVQAAPSDSPLNAAAVDVRLTVPDDLVIKGNDIRVGQSSMGLGNVNLTLGGDIRVRKAAGDVSHLVGQVRTIRGTYDFQGRRFDIQRGGTLQLRGLNPPNPALDITATRLITGVETRVHVGGTVRRPELTLTSNPPLDQADILSLIVFGQPSNQLGEGQQVSLAQRAGAIASGFVAGKLAQSIGSALNLDTFEIQTGTDTGQTGATVTVGEQIGQRLYVKLRQGVGAANTSEFVLDYQLTNFLRFETTMQQGGSGTNQNIMQRAQQSGADLIFLFAF